MAQTAVKAIISGRVQGVFFRAETRKAARDIGVGGSVENLPDGTVKAFFQGEQADVARMLEWCKKGSPGSRVDRIDTELVAPVESLTFFDIRW